MAAKDRAELFQTNTSLILPNNKNPFVFHTLNVNHWPLKLTQRTLVNGIGETMFLCTIGYKRRQLEMSLLFSEVPCFSFKSSLLEAEDHA